MEFNDFTTRCRELRNRPDLLPFSGWKQTLPEIVECIAAGPKGIDSIVADPTEGWVSGYRADVPGASPSSDRDAREAR